MHEFTYDAYRRLTKDKDGLLFETLFGYDNHGNTNSVTDALLKVWTYSNDVLGRVLTTTGPIAGLVWTNVYDAATGLLTESRDPRSVRSTVEYSSRGWMTRQVAADGSATPQVALSTFDVAGQQTGVRDGNGYWAQTQFDMRGRPVAVFDQAGSVIRSEFDAAGQRTASRDEQGFRTGFSVNSRGWTTQSTNALNYNTAFGFDAAGNNTSTTDALSHTWATEYNDARQVIKLTNPLLQYSQTVYNSLGQAEQSIDEAGRIGKQLYDVLGRPTTRTDGFGTALARNNTTGYNGRGDVSSQADGLNQTTNFGYDDAGRRTTTTDPLVHVWTTGYDLGGRAITSTDPLTKTTNLGYDDLGRQTSATDPNNNTTTKLYDGENRLVAEWDGAGNITHHVYDAAGREVLTIAPDGGLTQRTYEDRGLLTSLTDPVGNVTRWEYDALGRQAKEIDPTGASKTFEYDAAGRMTRATDRLGRVREMSYDNANRLTQEVWKNTLGGAVVETLSWTYFSDGRIASAANSEGTYSFTFDELARTKTQTGLFGLTLTLGYNAADDLTSLADSLGGTVSSVYDAAHRLTSRAFSGSSNGARAEFTYNDRNERTETRRYDTAVGGTKVSSTSFGYDDGGRLTGETHKDGAGSALVTYVNAFDTANRITSETRNGTPKNFTYDVNSQVTSDGTSNYSFDANGNRTMAGYTTGPANRITSDGTWTYTHDAEGNLTKKSKGALLETWTYGYDHRNQMLWAEQRATDGGSLQQRMDYGYDVYGNVIRRVHTISGNSTTTKTAFRITDSRPGTTKSVHQAWADLDGAGALTLRYLHGDNQGELLARITLAGVENWLLQDRLGSIREILDQLGVIVKQLGFDGFGNLILETGGADKGLYLFAGYRYDPVTLQFEMHWRRYDPKTGRFGAPDPIGFGGGLMNLYGHVGNNVTNATDLSGLAEDFGFFGRRNAAVGHHWVPVGVVTDDDIFKHMSRAAVVQQAGAVSGPTEPFHMYGTYGGVTHFDYNKLVKEELIEFMKDRGIVTEGKKGGLLPKRKMSAAEMKEFTDNIRDGTNLKSKDRAASIKKFNTVIKEEHAAYMALKKLPVTSITDAHRTSLGRYYVNNSRRYVAFAAFTMTMAGMVNTSTAFGKMAEPNSPYWKAYYAARASDDVGFERALIGDGIDPTDEQHLFGFLRKNLDENRQNVILISWAEYKTLVYNKMKRIKELRTEIDNLKD